MKNPPAKPPHSMAQTQFLSVKTAEEARAIFWDAIKPAPLGVEGVPIDQALGRVLAQDIRAAVDVPFFDRSNVDGYAICAKDSATALDTQPVVLKLNPEILHTGVRPSIEVRPGYASAIATGGVIPRGADAVVMVEHTTPKGKDAIEVYHSTAPGEAISAAGSDIAFGETVLHQGCVLTSRETGVLASLGLSKVGVYTRPKVAVLSTGDEIIAPGEPMEIGKIYDSNGIIIADAVREQGCDPVFLGIVADDPKQLKRALERACQCDFVLLSGGTSKGAGDVNYQVVSDIGQILVHGVALKPGKPLCLAMVQHTPLAILPGFPTSAVFTFHAFIEPILRCFSGLPTQQPTQLQARMPMRINSDKGRTEFLLVNLVRGQNELSAYPMGKGSGSVTAFSKADGFTTIPREQEYLDANAKVAVTLIGKALEPADFLSIGSHCLGLDALQSSMAKQGWRVKAIQVGSQGGVFAVQRDECDVAGVHLLEPGSGLYNAYLLKNNPHLQLTKGYKRKQGLVYRPDDPRFASYKTVKEAIEGVCQQAGVMMINRNRGSGTRVLIDGLLQSSLPHQEPLRPQGFLNEAKSHHAVAAAVGQGRADWGLAIASVAKAWNLGFLPYLDEEYDFIIPKTRLERPAVQAFLTLLEQAKTNGVLVDMGFF